MARRFASSFSMTATNFHTMNAAPISNERTATTLSGDDDGCRVEFDCDLFIIFTDANLGMSLTD